MRKVVLASHGSFAEGMQSAVKMILGNSEHVLAFGLDTYGTPQDIYQQLKVMIDDDQDNEYIILCDINGGSVHNQLMHLCMYHNVYLMCGVTLSIVLQLLLEHSDKDTTALLVRTMEDAKENMLLFTYQSVQKEIDKGIEDDKLW